MSHLPDAVKRAYEAEIRRLERRLQHVSEKEAETIREAIEDLEIELLVETWPD